MHVQVIVYLLAYSVVITMINVILRKTDDVSRKVILLIDVEIVCSVVLTAIPFIPFYLLTNGKLTEAVYMAFVAVFVCLFMFIFARFVNKRLLGVAFPFTPIRRLPTFPTN